MPRHFDDIQILDFHPGPGQYPLGGADRSVQVVIGFRADQALGADPGAGPQPELAGPVGVHQQHRGRAVGYLRRRARRVPPVRQHRPQLRQALQRGVPQPLVAADAASSWENTAIVRFQADMPRDRLELQRYVLLNMDPPQHTKHRAIVSRGFTPRAINSLRATLTARAERIVAEAAASGDTGDFVTEIACELPLQAIAELLGVPQEGRRNVFDWSNAMIGQDDPEYQAAADPIQPAMALLGYAMQMADERQSCPRDDIVTTLVKAEIDGTHLSTGEFGFFVLMLAVAGNETTRNAISHGMLALLEHPDQWELYRQTRPRTAVDRFVRWGTPVNAFQRTALHDTVLGGVPIAAGQRVAMFYGSAHYGEEIFTDPRTLGITRSPNPHLGFGGSGAHFCLGANLARLEIALIFNAIADQMPGISLAGPAQRLRSGWINGIKHLPVRYR